MWTAKTLSGPSFVGRYGTVQRLPTRTTDSSAKPSADSHEDRGGKPEEPTTR
jgi:hypothetical protein